MKHMICTKSKFKNLYPQFHAIIHNAILSSFSSRNKNNKSKEPELIASFMFKLIKNINKINPSIIRAGGVFVHASPLVSCKNFPSPKPTSVELGDLLLIKTEICKLKHNKYSALLLQAKKTKFLPCSPDNKNQYYLYSNWPKFTYKKVNRLQPGNKKKSLLKETRNINCKNIYKGTKYLLIDTSQGGWVPSANIQYIHCTSCVPACYPIAITAIATHTGLSNYEPFGCELVKFLLGNGGKNFKKNPAPTSRNWDRVIDDLLQNTAKSISSFTSSCPNNGGNIKRGNGYLYLSDVGNLNTSSSLLLSSGIINRPPQNDGLFRDKRSHGISIIEFVISLD